MEAPKNKPDKQDDKSTGSAFNTAAIGMSWQLAIIVLLPIIGGYKLDQKTGSMPWMTLLGLVLALVGSIIVIRRALAMMNNFNVEKPADSDDREQKS
jgi:LPXTG-motif cell wall-anchored protein